MSSADLDLRDRDRLFAALCNETCDVAVIGAGITGAGIARDAAMRGLDVVLLEAGDFAAGTSSRSSKLVHGGIRYLAQGDVGLVREAARDREVIGRLAPHLAERTIFVVPARSRWEMTKFRMALATYERIGSIVPGDRHESWGLQELAHQEPTLRTDGIVGALAYPEYITDDARLTLANVRGAALAGAHVANYTEVIGLTAAGHAGMHEIVTRDRLDGERECRVRARVVVNAAGPWADHIRRLEEPQATPKLMLTKGIHLVLSRRRLPIRHTVNLKASDARGLFAIPRGEMAYLGTTDSFYPHPDYSPEITADDIAYVLATANHAFELEPLAPRDIVSLWAGLRPLLAQPGKAPSEISRRDEIMVGAGGMITIAGGKLTAYRRMAERVVDRCQQVLGVTLTPSRTADVPLPGGDLAAGVAALAQRISTHLGTASAAERLVRLYGAEAAMVADDGGDVAAEVRQAVYREGAVQLDDYWIRRSARAWFGADGGAGALEIAAREMALLLGWSEAEQREQLERCRRIRRMEMAAISQAT
jgi:glycerol-3-phosphate dehydrogenase